MKYKFEKTILEEKETFIYIDKYSKEVDICTHDSTIYNKLIKKIGQPTNVFAPTKINNKDYISGATWNIKFKDRNKIKQVLSITNLLPRNKKMQ